MMKHSQFLHEIKAALADRKEGIYTPEQFEQAVFQIAAAFESDIEAAKLDRQEREPEHDKADS